MNPNCRSLGEAISVCLHVRAGFNTSLSAALGIQKEMLFFTALVVKPKIYL